MFSTLQGFVLYNSELIVFSAIWNQYWRILPSANAKISFESQVASFLAPTLVFCICSLSLWQAFQWSAPNAIAIGHFEHNFFQIEDFNTYFSQIKYFHLVQLAKKRNLFLRYPQSLWVDWGSCVDNLKRQVNISEVRYGAYSDVLLGN